MVEAVRIDAGGGVLLDGELVRPDGEPRAGCVLCHPHPQFGGTMRSIVISALFEAMPRAGVATLRFDFRGVGASTGGYEAGGGEQVDARAAAARLARELPAGVPLVVAGWSFGADMALSVLDGRVAGWLAIAPPLRFGDAGAGAGADPRPKHVVLGGRDELVPPGPARQRVAGWRETTVEEVPGASHFFVGRIEALTALALDRVSSFDGAGAGRGDGGALRRPRTSPA